MYITFQPAQTLFQVKGKAEKGPQRKGGNTMRYTKHLAGLAMVVGMLIPGAATLSAQDRRDIHNDRRDIHRDYDRVARMQADMNNDQARLNEDIRCGRSAAAARDAQDLARDQRAYNAQIRDIRHDQNDVRRDSYYGRDWR